MQKKKLRNHSKAVRKCTFFPPRKVGGWNEQNNLQELKIMRTKMKI